MLEVFAILTLLFVGVVVFGVIALLAGLLHSRANVPGTWPLQIVT